MGEQVPQRQGGELAITTSEFVGEGPVVDEWLIDGQLVPVHSYYDKSDPIFTRVRLYSQDGHLLNEVRVVREA